MILLHLIFDQHTLNHHLPPFVDILEEGLDLRILFVYEVKVPARRKMFALPSAARKTSYIIMCPKQRR